MCHEQYPIHLACLQRSDCLPHAYIKPFAGYRDLPHALRTIAPHTLEFDDDQHQQQVDDDEACEIGSGVGEVHAARPRLPLKRIRSRLNTDVCCECACPTLKWDVHSFVFCAYLSSMALGAVAAGLSCGVNSGWYDISYTTPSNYSISIGDCSYRNVSLTTGAVVFDYSCPFNTTTMIPPLPSAWQPAVNMGSAVCLSTSFMAGILLMSVPVVVPLVISCGLRMRWKAVSFIVCWLLLQFAMCIAWAVRFWPAMNEVTQGAVTSRLETGTYAYIAAACIVFLETIVVVALSLYFAWQSVKSKWTKNRGVTETAHNMLVWMLTICEYAH